jgi:cytosine/adenosine deaminase-related metal-dependent hydrolase
MDANVGDHRVADVFISGGRIEAIGPDLGIEDVHVIDATDMVVLPGLIDAHRHLFYTSFRGTMADMSMPDWLREILPRIAGRLEPEDLYASTLLGAADAINYGVTTVLDFCSAANSPAHAESAVAALKASGMRAIFGHGSSIKSKLGQESAAEGWNSARHLRDTELAGDGLVSLALALLGPDQSSMDATAFDVSVARELGVPMAMHIGGRPLANGIKQLADAKLLGADMNFSHCTNSTNDELRMLANVGAHAVASPTAESMMGSGTPSTGRMRDAGLRLAFGTDSVCCATGDLFQEARAALAIERVLRVLPILSEDRTVENFGQLGMTSREVLEGITLGGARATWMDDKIGSLTPGKRADVILLRKSDLNLSSGGDVAAALVTAANGGNVDTVIIDGEIVKRDGALVGLDLDRIRSEANDARDRVYALTDYPGIKP